MSETIDTFDPASPDDVCDNCSRTRAEHKSSICVTGGFCKFPVRQTKATKAEPCVYDTPEWAAYVRRYGAENVSEDARDFDTFKDGFQDGARWARERTLGYD